MQQLNKPLKFKLSDFPINLSDLWFQHHSPHKLNILKPQNYSYLLKDRAEKLGKSGARDYVEHRKETEAHYHYLLNSDKNKSFIYATIVGFNKMKSANEYSGFTYYFKLKPKQLNNVVFELVAGKNKNLDIDPAVGKDALVNCMKSWINNYKKFKPYYSELVKGNIDPRIEVVVPFNIEPISYFPEVEQR